MSSETFDPDRSTRRVLAGKWLMEPTKYVFRASALHDLTIFKIPEDIGTTLTVRGGSVAPERDFYELYQRWNLTGLRFERIWNEDIWRD